MPSPQVPPPTGPAHRLTRRLTRRLRAAVGRRLDAAVERRVRPLVAGELAGRLAPIQQELQAVGERERRHRDALFTTNVVFGAGQRLDRTLNPDRYAQLVKQIRAVTSQRQVEGPLQQAYRSLLDAEATGLGRVAGSTYNILGKLVIPPLLQPPEGLVLEIGTLFGLFSPTLLRQFRRAGQFRGLTVVDPFAGVQLQPGSPSRPDLTGTPVTEAVARRNLLADGLAADELEVITGFSGDADVRAQVGTRAYAVVVIDGDHSEDGVYADLRWTEQLTLPGGVVVIDDYGDPRWPGVQRACDRYLADGGRLRLIGTAATSAYLRMPTPV